MTLHLRINCSYALRLQLSYIHRNPTSLLQLQQLRRKFSSASIPVDSSILLNNFPLQYLRAMDSSNFDEHTSQRADTSFDSTNGKPVFHTTPDNQHSSIMPHHTIAQCSSDGSYYHVTWEDGHISKYSMEWLDETLQNWRCIAASKTIPYNKGRVLWKDLTEEQIRKSDALCIAFHDAITDDGMKASLTALYRYGFVLVTNTPIHDDGVGVAALASAFGGGCNKDEPSSLLMHYRSTGNRPRKGQIMLPHGTDGPLRTLYGTVWSTISSRQAVGTSTADSSFGHDGLPLHTDMTYRYDPPGLQIFTMIQPAVDGGDSILCDGYAVAAQLRKTNPDAFQTLCQTIRRYHCIDRTAGWHMAASGPIIGVDTNNNQIVMIRHNDLDRLPDLPSSTMTTTDFDDFYSRLQSAHYSWDQLLSDDSYRLVIRLRPGDTIVVANQRCLHGRCSFDTSSERPRTIMGCYVSQDELSSRFRMMGYNVW